MLDLIGFLSFMSFWWGSAFLLLLAIAMVLVSIYLHDIGCEALEDKLDKKFKALFCKPYRSEFRGSRLFLFIFGALAWGLSLWYTLDTEGANLWDLSVGVSNDLAPYVWWLSLFIIYPILVWLGKKVSFILKAVDKLERQTR